MSFGSRDPYEVLGVPRDATPEALRSAYRQKAMQYHPDRNPGDRQAEERFKELSEAYAVLRDPDSRADYDRHGPDRAAGYRHDTSAVDWREVFRDADIHIDWGSRGGIPHTGSAVFDVLFGMMAGVLRGAGLVAGRTYEVSLGLSLGELHSGATKRVRVPGPCVCPTCKGTGRAPGGDGVVRSPRPFEAAGPAPASGLCPDCGGRGVRGGGAWVDVKVPARAGVGGKLRLAGVGGPGNPPGDVIVHLGWVQPTGATARGRDVHAHLALTPFEARRGTTTSWDGVSVTVPPGTEDGSTITVSGKGLPAQGAVGDLHLTVQLSWLRGAVRALSVPLRKLTGGGEPR